MKSKNKNPIPELNIGDVILAGKFKNKRCVIKEFTTDSNNQPVIKTDRGKYNVFTFRLERLMPKKSEASIIKADALYTAENPNIVPYQEGFLLLRNIPARYAPKVIDSLKNRNIMKNLFRGTRIGTYSIVIPENTKETAIKEIYKAITSKVELDKGKQMKLSNIIARLDNATAKKIIILAYEEKIEKDIAKKGYAWGKGKEKFPIMNLKGSYWKVANNGDIDYQCYANKIIKTIHDDIKSTNKFMMAVFGEQKGQLYENGALSTNEAELYELMRKWDMQEGVIGYFDKTTETVKYVVVYPYTDGR